jgi:hypothetical protein
MSTPEEKEEKKSLLKEFKQNILRMDYLNKSTDGDVLLTEEELLEAEEEVSEELRSQINEYEKLARRQSQIGAVLPREVRRLGHQLVRFDQQIESLEEELEQLCHDRNRLLTVEEEQDAEEEQ